MKPCILIYNTIFGAGHIDSWKKMFARILLKRGYRVLMLTENQSSPEEVNIIHHSSFKGILFDKTLVRKPPKLLTIWRKFINFIGAFSQKYGKNYLSNLLTQEMPVIICIRKIIFRITGFFIYNFIKFISPDFYVSDSSVNNGLYLPLMTARQIRAAVKTSPWKPDFVFNMYMDMYDMSPKNWKKFDKINKINWGGIIFTANPEFPIEYFYKLKSFKGMCFLDQNTFLNYSKILPDKVFTYLPDITNDELPQQPPVIVKQIQKKSSGRKIVFMGGSIAKHKNLIRWYEIINKLEPSNWFFVQIGKVWEHVLTEEEKESYYKFITHPPENFFIFDDFLPNEQDFNSILNISDIIFAVYTDFKISSNMLTKAAYFNKPILVSEKYLMGERVKKYGIGIGVREDDSNAMISGLMELASKRIPEENFVAYRSDFNEDRLGDALENFINSCLNLMLIE